MKRSATKDQLEKGRDEWLVSLDAPDYLNKGRYKIFTKEEIEDIYNVLTTPELREMYDKHEQFIRLE